MITSMREKKKKFEKLKKEAKWFVNYILDKESVQEIHLMDIELAKNIDKRSKVVFRVAGTGSVSFVPIAFSVRYEELDEENEGVRQIRCLVIPQNHPLLIKMCKESTEAQLKDLKKFASTQLGFSVKIIDVEPTAYISITQIIALPKIKELKMGASGTIITEEGKKYRQKVVYLQEAGNNTSNAYEAYGYVMADPSNSEARLLVSDHVEIREEFEKFQLTSEVIQQFNSFKRKEDESIDEFFDRFVESAAYSFIRIYGEARKDAIIASMLCFHSPLYFPFEGEIIKGWLQIAFIGDTTTGKSQIARRMMKYANVGVYVTGETCTRTGFLYAIDTKTLSSCILTWGLFAQQDRSLLIIDGANYISQEDWGTAREARRSGKLIVERIVKGEHPCRTRLVLLANPPKALSQYIYPIESLRDIQQEPDIARLDLCVCFSQADVSIEDINTPQAEREKPRTMIDEEVFQNSIFWAWSRKPEDIVIDAETTDVINEVAISLLDKFGAATDVPLISNDVKYKVVRIATSFACFLHSTDKSHEKVIVTSEIVRMTEMFITRIYSASNCRLNLYARDRKEKIELSVDEFEVIQKALQIEAKKDRSNILKELISIFRSNNTIKLNEICARLDRSPSTIKSKLVFFKRFALVRSGKSGYAKTEKFVQFLNKLIELEKKALPSSPAHKKPTPKKTPDYFEARMK